MCNMPEYLYHYTSLESLALILKNKTIRFRPLNEMDDMDEEGLKDYNYGAKYVFVSSWTEDEKESIPFWSMYTNNMSGVRIRLHIKPFCRYSFYSTNGINVEPGFGFFIPMEKITGEDFLICPLDGELFFTKIEYTNDENKLLQKIGNEIGSKIELSMGEIGKYKREAWSFQKEWRYRLLCLPISIGDLEKDTGPGECIKRIKTGHKLPFNYIDLNIDETYLNDIEIMTGPKMSLGSRVLLDKLVECYCPNARIVNSDLKIR